MSRLQDYLDEDISKLISQGDFKKLHDIEKYLNVMSRQKLARLKKANLELGDDRVVNKWSNDDFKTTLIFKKNPTNDEIKRYQNQILSSISNAKKFLNLKTSSVRAFKSWSTTFNGSKYTKAQVKKMWRELDLLREVAGNEFNSRGSEIQQEITEYLVSGKPMSNQAKEKFGELQSRLKTLHKKK